MNERFGYTSPGDLRRSYTQFYWGVVRPHIKDALRYLAITQEGKQWIANLHSHVFNVEHDEDFLSNTSLLYKKQCVGKTNGRF